MCSCACRGRRSWHSWEANQAGAVDVGRAATARCRVRSKHHAPCNPWVRPICGLRGAALFVTLHARPAAPVPYLQRDGLGQQPGDGQVPGAVGAHAGLLQQLQVGALVVQLVQLRRGSIESITFTITGLMNVPYRA